MIALIAIIILPLTVLALPDLLLDKIYQKTALYFKIFKKLFEKLSGGGDLVTAQDLVTTLATLEASSIIKLKTGPMELPRYKFYTGIIDQMIVNAREYGCSIKQGVKTVRHAVAKDHQFERKIIKEHTGGFAQFLIITIISWSFFMSVKNIMSISISMSSLITIITLQTGGLFLYIYLSKLIKLSTFKGDAEYLNSIYILKSLIGTGLPIQSVINLSKVIDTINMTGEKFKHINTRITIMLERVQKTGTPIAEELGEIVEEVWFIHNLSFENFIKKTVILKFLIVAGFYLTSYFLFLIELFGNIM